MKRVLNSLQVAPISVIIGEHRVVVRALVNGGKWSADREDNR